MARKPCSPVSLSSAVTLRSHRFKNIRQFLTLVVFALWVVVPNVSEAQDEGVLANGKSEFLRHCASCHGVSATGNGALAAFLTIKPADLTQLSQKNSGQFPFWRVYSVIDGREEVMAHGSRRMPVWGSEFLLEEGAQPQAEDHVLGRILSLVYFIQSLQDKPQ